MRTVHPLRPCPALAGQVQPGVRPVSVRASPSSGVRDQIRTKSDRERGRSDGESSRAMVLVELLDALSTQLALHQARPRERQAEVAVLLAARRSLGRLEVVAFEAPTDHLRLRVLAHQRDQAVSPSLGQHGGRRLDALGVVAVRLVEHRPFTDRAVDPIR